MMKFIFLNRLAFGFALIILVGACNNSISAQTQSDYDKLCVIYKETLKKDISPDMQAYEIATRAEKEVPDIFTDFEHISSANAEDAYPLLKKSAERATQKPWECPVIKDYYDSAYQKKLEREKKLK